MASTSFGSKKRPAGKQWRSSSSKEIFDNLYKNVDAAFTALEAAVSAGYAPVRSATTGNVANRASFTVSNDGVTLVAGDRVLLKSQNTAAQNGIYVVGTVANGSAPLTRATDMAAGATFTDGDAVWCQEGTANGNKEFRLTTTGVVEANNIAYVTLTTSINAGSITATEIASGSITADRLAAGAAAEGINGGDVQFTAAQAAGALTVATVPVLLELAIPNAASTSLSFTGLVGKHKVLDFWVVTEAAGDAGNKYELDTSADVAISDDIAPGASSGSLKHAASLDATNKILADASTFKVKVTRNANSCLAKCYLLLVPTA